MDIELSRDQVKTKNFPNCALLLILNGSVIIIII